MALAWLLFSGLMAVLGPYHTPEAISLLLAIGVFQIVAGRHPAFRGRRGQIGSFAITLTLCLVLINYTDGISSSYYWMLLVPVITAAPAFSLLGTLTATLLACGGYLSFLAFIDWQHQYIPPDAIRELVFRVLALAFLGLLTNQIAEGSRAEARKAQDAADQLARANLQLMEAEAAVRRTERLAAIGQMSAGLAHELRNPLGTIKASAEMLTRNLDAEGAIAKEMAEYISTEVDRTNTLVTRFLDFARPLAVQLQKGDITQTIDRAVEEMGRSRDLSVSVYRNYAPDIAPFPFDPALMERVFYNLLVNAAQASPRQSCITVKTRQMDNTVEIAVIDRGSGIDPKHMESIFNPFFTTKTSGTGLGLAIVSRIVDEHGGSIAVESEPGSGSIFRVLLPVNAHQTSGGER
ncbi:MAG TPA: ATP-binding protein [Bryobacteraceae bacterium]|nr:ATP-binding protein [Bryobacteraceae bacterium]